MLYVHYVQCAQESNHTDHGVIISAKGVIFSPMSVVLNEYRLAATGKAYSGPQIPSWRKGAGCPLSKNTTPVLARAGLRLQSEVSFGPVYMSVRRPTSAHCMP